MLGGVLDRYMFAKVAGRFAMVVGIILTILSLENFNRLLSDVQRTGDPMLLLGRLTLALLPEHLSAAVPVGLMLAVALSVRQMVLRAEWQILGAARMGRLRMLAGPLAFAVLVAGFQLAVRMELRPAGERGLDSIYREVQLGTHGLFLPTGEPIPLDAMTTLFVTRVGDGGDQLEDVVVRRGEDMFSAPVAEVDFVPEGGVRLMLRDGTGFVHHRDGSLKRVRFDAMQVLGSPPVIGMVGDDARHRLDRSTTAELIALARNGSPAERDGAWAAMVMRVHSALFCLLLPWLALVLGKPPRRAEGAAGIGVGLVLVVLQLKSAAMIEDRFAHHIVIAEMIHLALWVALAVALTRLEDRYGEGFIDSLASRGMTRLKRLRPRLALPMGTRAIEA
jgi:lipopolysaccharide export system permease protein